MGKQKQANQVAKKAASDGKITAKEAAKVQKVTAGSNANAAIAIAKAAANNQAQIANAVQRQLGLDQTGKGVNYSPGPSNPLTGQGKQMKPGVAPITGSREYQTNDPWTGSTNHQAPVYTFFDKPKAGSGANATKAPAAPAGVSDADIDKRIQDEVDRRMADLNPMNKQTDQWGESVDSGLEDLQAILAQQMASNAEQTSLYMGMMQDMMSQMQTANATPQGAYSVSTSTAAPAQGAVQTQAINRRKPIANTDLSIPGSSAEAASGAGLNLAI